MTLLRNREQQLTEVGCQAHVRRKYYEAQTSDVCRATVVMAYIGLLYYEVEQDARVGTLHAPRTPGATSS